MRTKIFLITILFLLLLALPAFAETKVLLHFNGTAGSTSFVDSSIYDHDLTASGDASISGTSKFGNGSLALDGIGDYVAIGNKGEYDWFLDNNSTEWTIDFWVKSLNVGSPMGFLSQYVSVTNYYDLYVTATNLVAMYGAVNGSVRWDSVSIAGERINDNDWHHVAFYQGTTNFATYIDGDQVTYGNNQYSGSFLPDILIGVDAGEEYFKGYIDEIRISDTNLFGASPNYPDQDDTITVPTAEEGGEDISVSQTNVVVMM